MWSLAGGKLQSSQIWEEGTKNASFARLTEGKCEEMMTNVCGHKVRCVRENYSMTERETKIRSDRCNGLLKEKERR